MLLLLLRLPRLICLQLPRLICLQLPRLICLRLPVLPVLRVIGLLKQPAVQHQTPGLQRLLLLVLVRLLLLPLDSLSFWKRIIQQRKTFPKFHILLRATLALTASNAAVEQAFSQLGQLLAPRRLSSSSALVEQFMILALDATAWEKYDYEPVWQIAANNQRRARFRLARTDKGQSKKGKERVVGAKRKRGDANGTIYIDSENSSGNEAILLSSSDDE